MNILYTMFKSEELEDEDFEYLGTIATNEDKEYLEDRIRWLIDFWTLERTNQKLKPCTMSYILNPNHKYNKYQNQTKSFEQSSLLYENIEQYTQYHSDLLIDKSLKDKVFESWLFVRKLQLQEYENGEQMSCWEDQPN